MTAPDKRPGIEEALRAAKLPGIDLADLTNAETAADALIRELQKLQRFLRSRNLEGTARND